LKASLKNLESPAVLNEDLNRNNMKINWVELDEIEIFSKGHGVLLCHEGLNDLVIAFIEGYGWKHKTSNEMTVEILKPDCKPFQENGIDGIELIDELRLFISRYFARKRVVKNGKMIGRKPKMIKLWFHG